MTNLAFDWHTKIEELDADVAKLQQWVHDLQSGMYINCVYCGHRYGPQDEVPATMADALKEHIENCPHHPMSALKRRLEQVETHNASLQVALGTWQSVGAAA